MPGPREYTRSTIFSLAALGGGTCYWPNPPCGQPVTVIIDGEPITNLQIAHIRAANLNGPRYVPDMSDDDRRSWKNLILLCTPHHNIIDKLHPADYSIEDLEGWKSGREKGNLARLQGLRDLTEDRLQEIISDSMKEAYKEVEQMLAERRPLDPDAAMLLSGAADHLNMYTAELFYSASSMLAPALNEYADILLHAADRLVPTLNEQAEILSSTTDKLVPALDEHVETLSNTTDKLVQALNEHAVTLASAAEYLPDLIEALDERIRQLRNVLGDM
jgi:hypothetical protein